MQIRWFPKLPTTWNASFTACRKIIQGRSLVEAICEGTSSPEDISEPWLHRKSPRESAWPAPTVSVIMRAQKEVEIDKLSAESFCW
jgi:hypothetical protein